MNRRIGILGIGTHLPEEIRTNDWWPRELVASWHKRPIGALSSQERPISASPGAQLALAAMGRYADDPFKGGVARRIAPKDQPASDMEVLAARDALKRSGVPLDQVTVVIVHSVCPDYLNVPNACRVHAELGLSERCLSLSIDGMCNAFQMQLTMAQRLLQGDEGGYALLVQSCSLSRFVSSSDPMAPLFGDGATAVVVGTVSDDVGIVAAAHYTDGKKFKGLTLGVPGKRWYEEGTITTCIEDKSVVQRVVLDVVDHAKQAIGDVLEESDVRPENVAFYAAHQGTVWLREVTQHYAGLANARSIDTFAQFASLSACNLPLVLAVAERERVISRGDFTILFSGGSGETWSSTALVWGA